MWRRTRCHRPFRCLRLGLSLMAFVMATESLLVLTSDSIVCEFFSECQKTKGKRNSSILIIDCTFSKKHTPHKMYLFNLEVSNFCLHVIRRIRSVIAMNKKKTKRCVSLLLAHWTRLLYLLVCFYHLFVDDIIFHCQYFVNAMWSRFLDHVLYTHFIWWMCGSVHATASHWTID